MKGGLILLTVAALTLPYFSNKPPLKAAKVDRVEVTKVTAPPLLRGKDFTAQVTIYHHGDYYRYVDCTLILKVNGAEKKRFPLNLDFTWDGENTYTYTLPASYFSGDPVQIDCELLTKTGRGFRKELTYYPGSAAVPYRGNRMTYINTPLDSYSFNGPYYLMDNFKFVQTKFSFSSTGKGTVYQGRLLGLNHLRFTYYAPPRYLFNPYAYWQNAEVRVYTNYRDWKIGNRSPYQNYVSIPLIFGAGKLLSKGIPGFPNDVYEYPVKLSLDYKVRKNDGVMLPKDSTEINLAPTDDVVIPYLETTIGKTFLAEIAFDDLTLAKKDVVIAKEIQVTDEPYGDYRIHWTEE